MKHKYRETGFSLHLVLVLILLAAALGSSSWYVITRHRSASDNQGTHTDDFIPGEITVIFKDGVSFGQAQTLINSLSLKVNDPQASEQDFIPTSYRAIRTDEFTEIQNKLKNYSGVISFIDDSSDPVNNRAGAGQKWVKVTWSQDVTYDRIKKILVASGLGLGSGEDITRTIYLKVPDGQENSYISQLKRNAIVQSADRESPSIVN